MAYVNPLSRESMRNLLQQTKTFAQEDLRRSWTLWIWTFIVWAAVWACTFPWAPLVVRIAAGIGAGLVTVRLFIFYHDYLHGALFRTGRLHEIPMWIYGVLTLNPPSIWRRSHNYHHQNNSQIATASIGSFPILTLEQYREASKMQRIMYHLSRHGLTMLFGYFFVFVLGMCTKSFITDPKRHWDSLVALIIHVALLGVFFYIGDWTIFLSYLLPLSVACCVGAYLFYIQHNFPDMKLTPRGDWDYVHAALQSSSYMKGNALVHWLTGNIGYHHVHHLNPLIPFYRLPEAMAAIPELQNPGVTNLRPTEIYRCLNLIAWHPVEKRMLSKRALRSYLKQKPMVLSPVS